MDVPATLENVSPARDRCLAFRSIIGLLAGGLLWTFMVAEPADSAEIGLWTFEEYAGQAQVPSTGIIQDTSGNQRHMFSLGGKTVTAGSAPGTTALEFTGTLRDLLEFQPGFNSFSNSAATASSSDIVFGANDSFTIEVVVTLPHDNLYGVEGRILGKGRYASGVADEWNFVAINNSNNHPNSIEAFLGDGENSGNGFYAKPAKSNVATGWRHLGLVRNRSTDKIQLYVDRSLVATSSDGFQRIDLSTATGNFMVGGNKHVPVKPFRGSIDMVRISDMALSPQEFFGAPVNANSIPEPASLVLAVPCLVGLLVVRRR